ncbi:hypothetical protein GGR56DRAFT_644430 [Xylariaceae sp. FL0804]|nr:hypothetical protein GGR56DRAFT_644430 [Xylariaceae sp. FL0804]
MGLPRGKGPAEPVHAVRRIGQPGPRFNYELFCISPVGCTGKAAVGCSAIFASRRGCPDYPARSWMPPQGPALHRFNVPLTVWTWGEEEQVTTIMWPLQQPNGTRGGQPYCSVGAVDASQCAHRAPTWLTSSHGEARLWTQTWSSRSSSPIREWRKRRSSRHSSPTRQTESGRRRDRRRASSNAQAGRRPTRSQPGV